MSALVGGICALVGAVRIAEWAVCDHERDDLWTGLFFLALATVAFAIAGASS